VSHSKERKEKACLNCGAAIYGRYCHICGQENIETKETFWSLATHFVHDITHFDGKFFSTLKYLLFKPGFLTTEYLRGKRASYLHPIRMYVFTSAFFFLIYFSFYQSQIETPKKKKEPVASMIKKMKEEKENLLTALNDSTTFKNSLSTKTRIEDLDYNIILLTADSTQVSNLKSKNISGANLRLTSEATNFKDFAKYDSAQKTLPEKERDGFIRRAFQKQNFHLKEKYGDDGNEAIKGVLENLFHHFPQMLFVSLPLFALILLLLYRRQKDYYYVSHVIYAIHLYCGTFIIILFCLWFQSLLKLIHISMPDWLIGVLSISGIYYWYKSLRNFYGQSRKKTMLKFSLLLFFDFFLMMILFCVFFLFSVMTI
jgi:uncharacterized membrane protein